MLLSKDLERLILRQIESGRFRSAEEVIDKAVRVLDSQDQGLEERASRFKARIEERLEHPATPLDFAAVKREIAKELVARKAGRH